MGNSNPLLQGFRKCETDQERFLYLSGVLDVIADHTDTYEFKELADEVAKHG